MNDWDSLVILFNTANIIFLAAFMAKKNYLAEITDYYRDDGRYTLLLIYS